MTGLLAELLLELGREGVKLGRRALRVALEERRRWNETPEERAARVRAECIASITRMLADPTVSEPAKAILRAQLEDLRRR